MRAIDTPRLHLRPLGAEDEAFYCGLYTNPGLMRHIGMPLSIEAARNGFLKACQLNDETELRYRAWIIEERRRRTDIGLLGLIRNNDTAEIGAMLLGGSQGKGFAAEAIRVLVDYAFMEHDLTSLYTRHSLDNGLAIGLMGKLGFVCVASDMLGDLGYRWQLPRQHWEAEVAMRDHRCGD